MENVLTRILKDASVKPLDDNGYFSYAAVFNAQCSHAFGIYSAKPKVVIFDTRTSYFNATKLIDAFRDNENKNVQRYTTSSAYKCLKPLIEDKLEVLTETDKQKYFNTPALMRNESHTVVISSYAIKTPKKRGSLTIPVYDGMYLHPAFFVSVITYANAQLFETLSYTILSDMIVLGLDRKANYVETIMNNSQTVSRLVAERTQCVNDKVLTTDTFDMLEWNKLFDYQRLEESAPRNTKTHEIDHLVKNVEQALVVIRYFQDENDYDGTEDDIHLMFRVIAYEDLRDYVYRYDNQGIIKTNSEDEYASWEPFRRTTKIVLKCGPCYDLPYDIGYSCAQQLADDVELSVIGEEIIVKRDDLEQLLGLVKVMMFGFMRSK